MGTSGYQWVPVGTSEYQWVSVGTSGYQEYQEDQDQISGATYISDVVFLMVLIFEVPLRQRLRSIRCYLRSHVVLSFVVPEDKVQDKIFEIYVVYVNSRAILLFFVVSI